MNELLDVAWFFAEVALMAGLYVLLLTVAGR